MPTISDITAFYADIAGDHQGRLITDIWQFNLEQLDSSHDYIQWLFPLNQPSQANPKAPLLTKSDLEEFHHSPILKNNLLRSLDMMLEFYGFHREHQQIIPRSDFAQRSSHWLKPNNHNLYRITRILKSLRLLGLEHYAELLFKVLQQLFKQQPTIIGDSFNYWQRAANIIKVPDNDQR